MLQYVVRGAAHRLLPFLGTGPGIWWQRAAHSRGEEVGACTGAQEEGSAGVGGEVHPAG